MRSTDYQSRWLRLAKAMKPNTLVKALSGAPLIWSMLADDGTPATTIHRMFSQQCWREDGIAGGAVLVAGAVFMLPTLMVAATVYTSRCGARVRIDTGKSRPRQWAEQVSLGVRLAVPPPWYYIFELYRPTHYQRAAEYLYRSETKSGIYDMLRRQRGCHESTEGLRDKALFGIRCREHGLPVVDTLATARDGVIEGIDTLPDADLFFKPISGAGGRGASRWIFIGDNRYRASDGQVVTKEVLQAHLCELSRDERYLVRRYVTAEPTLSDLTPGALSTVRVVTCLDATGTPEATHAVFRMASSRDVVVDNFHAGGVAASVDLATGTLGMATDLGLSADSRWWSTHPTTGAPILGRRLPHWEAVRDLATRAHCAFGDQVAIGWDIAILENGPCLIEGNKSPDLDIVQRTSRTPAGNSRLGDLLAQHLTNAFAT
ncbi:sugar-transfer associated ATP-grasp domain-containing protein [Salinisphaera sp. RV14]|uniref:sugar-transfer associated ATP-grasp domain-containing protein n=1 Tax=Salinisphaera sp. RV14 TaxID=3454140 RepID=UPI003F85085F